MAEPILVLQVQRMGDLVLSFPLILWLQRLYPGHPIRVVAERIFYEGLMAVSPAVTYFPWEGTDILLADSYRLVINLSHRPEAAALAGRVRAAERIGPAMTADGATYIHGRWQLYRASLTGNNRHNRFHWADLNGLDAVPLPLMASTAWDTPRTLAAETRSVGLFLGASEEAKRPDASFWASLVRELLGRDLRPVLLGGPAEAGFAAEVAALAGAPVLNLAGRLSLAELVVTGQTLQLLVTPDTGPMHLAAWSGLRVLNLSMGPVNAWETGPYQPGHHILRPAWSCTGCWACSRPGPYSTACRGLFQPARIATLARTIIRRAGGTEGLGRMRLPGLDHRLSWRNGHGLYHLQPLSPLEPTARERLSSFWYSFFGHAFGLWDDSAVVRDRDGLEASFPRLALALARHLAGLGRDLKDAARRGSVLDEVYWRRFPPFLRPFSGYLHLLLQNSDYSRQGLLQAASLWERLAGVAVPRV